MGSQHDRGALMNAPADRRKRYFHADDSNGLEAKPYQQASGYPSRPFCDSPGAQYSEPPFVLPPPFLRNALPYPPPWGIPPQPSHAQPYSGPYDPRRPSATALAAFQASSSSSGSTHRCSLVGNRRVGGGLPKEWCQYTTHAAFTSVANLSIAGVFPCKTFLDRCFEDKLAQPDSVALGGYRERWRPGDAIDVAGSLKEWSVEKDAWVDPTPASPRIAAVVSLTLTERYYSSRELESNGVEYYWLPADGGGSVPRVADIQQFLELFAYLSYRFPGQIIAMHCTHGVNRTGFYFSLLLMAFGGVPHSEAVNIFSRVRGHPINRAALVEGLSQLEGSLFSTPEFQSFMEHLKRLARRDKVDVPPLDSTRHSLGLIVSDTAAHIDSHAAVAREEEPEKLTASAQGNDRGTSDASEQEPNKEDAKERVKACFPVEVIASYVLGGQKEACGEDSGEDADHHNTDKNHVSCRKSNTDQQTAITLPQATVDGFRDVYVRIRLTHPQQIAITKLYVELLRHHYCAQAGDSAGTNLGAPKVESISSVMPLGVVGLHQYSEENQGGGEESGREEKHREESDASAEQFVSEEASNDVSLTPQLINVMFTGPLFASTAFNNCILKLTQQIPRLETGIVQLCANAPKHCSKL